MQDGDHEEQPRPQSPQAAANHQPHNASFDELEEHAERAHDELVNGVQVQEPHLMPSSSGKSPEKMVMPAIAPLSVASPSSEGAEACNFNSHV